MFDNLFINCVIIFYIYQVYIPCREIERERVRARACVYVYVNVCVRACVCVL